MSGRWSPGKIILIAVLTLAAVTGAHPAAQAGELIPVDLRGAVDLALRQNPQVLVAGLEQEQAGLTAAQTAAEGLIHPSAAAERRAELGKAAAALNLQSVRQTVRRQAVRSYFEALSASSQAEIARRSAGNAVALAAAARARVAEGTGSELEAQAAEQAAREANGAAADAGEAQKVAEANLCLVLGLPIDSALRLDPGDLKFLPFSVGEAELVAGGLANSVELARATQEAEAARAEATGAGAGRPAALGRRLAELSRDKALLAERQIRDQVALQAKQHLFAVSQTRRTYERAIAAEALTLAQWKASQARFAEGLIVPTEVVKAELDYATAQVSAAKALLEYQLARQAALDFAGFPGEEVAR